MPVLTRELAGQTFLMGLFERWATTGDHPATVDDVKAMAREDLTEYMDRTASVGGAAAGGPAPSAAGPAFGTDLKSPNCGLVEYVTDGQGRSGTRPTTPQKVRQEFCRPIADYLLAHENAHSQSCLKAWKSGTQASLLEVDFYVKNDAAAYAAGVKVLQAYVDEAQKKCNVRPGWGSDTMCSGGRKAPKPCCARQ